MDYRLTKWGSFSLELSKILRFWAFGALFFSLYRLVFILFFRNQIKGDIHLADYLSVFFTGFRFDAMVVSYFVILPFALLLTLSCFNYFSVIKFVRELCESLFVCLGTILCMVHMNYYMEFKNTFDNNLFMGLFEEDKGTLLQMIWEYKSPFINLSLLVILLFVGFQFFKISSRKDSQLVFLFNRIHRKRYRSLLVVLSIYCMVAGLRGTMAKNILRVWSSAVTTDIFLNKAVLNPFKSFEIAYKDYKESYKLEGHNPYLDEAVADLLPYDKVDECITHEADTEHIEKPKQIFLVIMESYDAWSLLDKYRPFHVSDQLCRLADNGTTFMNFLPSHNSTIIAYSSIVSGVPHVGVNLSQVHKKENHCISSIYNHFMELGYTTNFFYGGYLSWQKIDDFSDYLGCDNAYSAANMGQDFKEGCWGVEDEDLFQYVVDTIDPEEYSLNVILTGSFHPPFSVDVYSKGFPYHTVEDLPQEVRGYFGDTMSIYELGHRWYGDYAIGKFMDWAEKKYPEALYAFTGDHYARNFINDSPNLYERSAVPFILYGKNIPAQNLDTPGSHIDIMPTLVELVAPEGFKYHSFGSSMFEKDKYFGVAYDKFITSKSLFHQIDRSSFEKIEQTTEKESMIHLFPYQKEHYRTLGLAWNYVANGNKLLF